MDPSWVQRTGIVAPWRLCLFLSHGVEIGGAAAVGPVTGQAFQIAMLLQLAQRPLDRAAGEIQVSRDGADAGPAFMLCVTPVTEVHVDGSGPVGQQVIGIDGVKIAHSVSSSKLVKDRSPEISC